MSTVYVAVIEDRHFDPRPEVFSTSEAAIGYARDFAESAAAKHGQCVVTEERVEHFLYYAVYCVEGDTVWVVERTLDAPEDEQRG